MYVHLSGLDSEALEDVGGHHRALNVPAGPPLPEWRVPRRLAFLGLLPEREVVGAFLLVNEVRGARKDALALGQELLVAFARGKELAVAVHIVSVKVSDTKVHGAVGLVCETLVDDPLNIRRDLRHELANPGNDLGFLHPQQVHVLHELLLPVPCQLREGDVSLRRALDDLVVNVGDVHDEGQVVPEVALHDALDDVKAKVSTGVAHVAGVVHGGTAHVPADGVATVLHRQERHLGAGQGVKHVELGKL
mmetsp:Transcript_18714/g.37542  ORF Transcript_18714/g.37542 Transcript_18714/m.37542 type:complete len:249 (-) Transcript_18714:284-1030(-)